MVRSVCSSPTRPGPVHTLIDRGPFGWATAVAAYGFSKGWRSELEKDDVFHAMATNRHETVVSYYIACSPELDPVQVPENRLTVYRVSPGPPSSRLARGKLHLHDFRVRTRTGQRPVSGSSIV